MTTLRDQYSETIEALDELSEEELSTVHITTDIVFTDTGERINICEAPIKQFFSAFGGMMDLSDIGNCSNEEFESIFDSLGIDINPEFLGEAEETED